MVHLRDTLSLHTRVKPHLKADQVRTVLNRGRADSRPAEQKRVAANGVGFSATCAYKQRRRSVARPLAENMLPVPAGLQSLSGTIATFRELPG